MTEEYRGFTIDTGGDPPQVNRMMRALVDDVHDHLDDLPREVFADGTLAVTTGSFTSGQQVRDWVFQSAGASAIPFVNGIIGVKTPFKGGVVAAVLDFIGGMDNAHTDTQMPATWTVYNTATAPDGFIIVNYRAWLANGSNPNGYSRRFVARVTGW